MRTLGIVKEAASDFQNYAAHKFRKDEEGNAARGAVDQAAGTIDPELQRKSAAYKDSVARGRTASAWNDYAIEMDSELAGIVENQQQLTLEERREELTEFLETKFHDFAVNAESGQLQDFLATPGAMRWLGEKMGESRSIVQAKATEVIEARFNSEAMSHFTKNLRDQAKFGAVNLPAALALVPPTVPDRAKREAIMETSLEIVDQLKENGREVEARQLLDSLLAGGFAVGEGGSTDEVAIDAMRGGVAEIAIPASSAAPAATQGTPAATAYSRTTLKAKIRGPESGGDDNATNGMGSSASGRYQFVEGTFKQLYKRVYGASSSAARDAWATKRFDVTVQEKLMDALVADNEATLAAARIPINDANMYVMHVLGSGNGPKFLKASPATPVSDILSVEIVKQNPTYFGGGKTVAQAAAKMASVVGGSADGAAGPSGIPANPEYRSPVAKLSPLEQYMKAPPASTPEPVMVGGLALTQTERNHLLQVREQFTERAISKWHKEEKERMGRNASTLTMGILGQGAPVSFETITSMAASGEIDEDDAVRLATFLESRSDRVVAEAERQEAARSRDQQRAADDLVESGISSLILPALTGRKTPEQVRSEALTAAARLARTRPLEAAKIVSGVNAALGGLEGTREGTTGYRDVISTFDKSDRDFFAGKAIRMQGVPTRRRDELVKFTDDLVTRGARRLQRELVNGTDPAKSAEAVRLWITQQMNLKAAQYATAAR